MSDLESTTLFFDTSLKNKIQWLIFGRLALLFLLLSASWWWTSSYLQLSNEFFPIQLFSLFVVSLFLTFIYLLLLHFNRNYFLQIRIQFLIDILLVTFLIWGTGDIISPYITLYILLITASGFFLGNRETLFISILCAICFTIVPILTSQAFILSFSGEERPSRIFQITAFNNIAILIVGLLAARLSERRKITEELKQTTESFADLHILHERIVESIHSGLITTDLEGKIYSFNRAAEEITGLSADQLIGDSIFTLFGEEIHAQVDACLKEARGEEFLTENFEAVLKFSGNENKNSKIAVSCLVTPLISRKKEVYGLIFTFQDITAIRTMEEKIRRSEKLSAIGRMAAGLAHEIRNPLGSMGSALQFLQEKLPPNSTEASLMDVVLRESDRLNNIITNFLTYARPSANVFSKEGFAQMDVCEAIRDCLVLLQHSPEIKQIHNVECDLPEKPINILANETQLKQVFWNLSKNSVQAMPDGGKLSIKLKENSKNKVRIIFEDTGKGISPEYLEHIFEPFSDKANGTGLGLSIVHKIIQEHGGKIDVKSELGKGTKITVDLLKNKIAGHIN